MPELPEVENVARALRETLTGRRLDGIDISYSGILVQSTDLIRSALIGKTLAGVHRHGKYLILDFSRGLDHAHLMIHLRMTGQIFIMESYVPDKHVHLTFDFAGFPVHYRDIRKFGRMELVDDANTPSAIAHVGPDMLQIKRAEWMKRIAHRKAPIKSLLLNQGIAAGLGNIYVDESLFLAKVHPLCRPNELDPAILGEVLKQAKQVLRLAIKYGGTTFMNFANFHGKPGNFKSRLLVYGRSGQPCTYCKEILQRLEVSGRSTVFCPSCQPEPCSSVE